MGLGVICFHPDREASVAEACLQALTGLRIFMATQGSSLLVKQDAVAATQRGQWAYQMQGLPQITKFLPSNIQTLMHRTR